MIVALLPLVPLLAGILVNGYYAARDGAAQRVQEVARGTAQAVERELRVTIASLETLAQSPTLQPSLATGDFSAFRREAETLGQRQFPGSSIALLDLTGQQFFNTFKPSGSLLPRRPNLEALERVTQTALPAVSDVFMATLQQTFIVPIDVPVFNANGQVRAVLSVAPPLKTFADLIGQQRPDPGWVVSILDRSGVVVARSPDGDRFVGKPALPAFRRLLAERAEGTADVVSLNGTKLLAGWSRAGPSGWSVGIGIPHAQFYPALWRTLTVTLAVSILTLVGALMLAKIVARQIARPVQALARYASDLSECCNEPTLSLGLHEADAVFSALCAATAERRAAEVRLREMEAESRAELERRIEQRTAELQQAQAQLLQAQRMEAVGQLTAGVAHDFNNLLQAQIMGLELLRDCVAGNQRATRYVELAIASGKQGAKLTHSLLSFSRQQMLRPESVRLPEMLDRLRDLLARTLGPQITLQTGVAAGTAPPLADQAHLEAALLNLCLNARDAMREGGGTVRVEAYPGGAVPADVPDGMDADRVVVLAVSDEGEGMDAATLARACEPFFSTKGVGRGSGLGLSMVHGFARQSGGELRIQSWPGVGTRVEIWLPQSELLALLPAGDLPLDGAAESLALVRGCGRVLLVDDDDAVRELCTEALQEAGYDVVRATSGEEALATLQAGWMFDVLVTDYAMPGITGGELVKRAQMLRPGMPVLVITGYAESTSILQAPGRVEVVHKPVGAQVLAERVAALVNQRAEPAQAVVAVC